MPLLEIRDLAVSFGGVTAVDGVNLKVHEGEVVGLIGPNGAGKTTMFNLLTGALKAQRGNVRFRGMDVMAVSTWMRAKLGMGRTFQLVQIFQGMTVRETLIVASHRHTRSGVLADSLRMPRSRLAVRSARERADYILEFLGLGHLADTPASALPLGQARMLELGRALCLKPKVLLLDEPASGMDHKESEEFVKLLGRVRDSFGLAILLVEHDMSVVMCVCDYIYVLDFGRLIAEGFPEEIQRHPEVIRAYLGDQETQDGGERPAGSPKPETVRREGPAGSGTRAASTRTKRDCVVASR
ncbi:MAG: ABC transporter ATP-binding protein [Actinomycetota bacterium]